MAIHTVTSDTLQQLVDDHTARSDVRAGRAPAVATVAATQTQTVEPTADEVAAWETAELQHETAQLSRDNAFKAATAPHVVKIAELQAQLKPVPEKLKPGFEWRFPDGRVLTKEQYDEQVVGTAQRLHDSIKSQIDEQKAAIKGHADKAQADVIKSWDQRCKDAALPGWSDVVANPPKITNDEVRSAILQSRVGPAIVKRMFDDPAALAHLNALGVRAALIEIGQLEHSIGRPRARVVTVKASAETSKAIAAHDSKLGAAKASQRVKAVKDTSLSAADAKLFSDKGEFTGTPAQWRQLRAAGKIN